MERTSFLTANEKRAAVGYEALDTGGDLPGAPPASKPPSGSDPAILISSGKPGLAPSFKYSPNQPRVPRGHTDGGQWTDGGGGASSAGPAGGEEQVAAASSNNGPRILGRGPKDFGKRVNTPSPKDVNVKMEHIIEGHTAQGSRYSQSVRNGGGKTAFPESMSAKDIEKAVREAYSNAREVSPPQYNRDGKIRLLEGESRGLKIQMYYNSDKKTIDSAWPRK